MEQLEALATRNERENTIVEELRSRIVQLETEKIEKAEDRQRFEKVLFASSFQTFSLGSFSFLLIFKTFLHLLNLNCK